MSRLLRSILAVSAALVLMLTGLAPDTAKADVDIYTTDGTHHVNGREWRTTCEPYSVTKRCRTEIRATQVSYTNGRFVQVTDWVFNNLTYAASARNVWKNNPVGGNGVVGGRISWTADDGRKWRTECDTLVTGRNGCRSYVEARVIESFRAANGGTAYRWTTKWILNNMVRFTAGSSSPSSPSTPGQNTVEPYVVKGRVTNRYGQPLAGVEVGADNTLLYNSNVVGVSDANGYYRISLAGTHTTWKMWGYVTRSYHGNTYRERLWSDQTGFASSTGAVRNLQWRLEGLLPGSSTDYFGATAEVHESLDAGPDMIEDMGWVRVTFAPVGPLIDGTQGQTLVRGVNGYQIQNIPIGRYRISATYTRPGSAPVALRVKDWENYSAPFASSVELVFPPDDELMIEVMLP